MDIIEYTEKVLDVKLSDWQKDNLRHLSKLRDDEGLYVIMRRHNGIYIYKENANKEVDPR